MQIRIIAAGLLFFSCTAAGIWKSWKLYQRLWEIHNLQELLQVMRLEILYSQTPLEAAARRAEEKTSGASRQFCCLLQQKLSENCWEDFSQIWDNVCSDVLLKTSLLKADVEPWQRLGRQLGRGGTVEQEKVIVYAERQLAVCEDQARNDFRQRGRMYGMIGVCCGIFLTVLLM